MSNDNKENKLGRIALIAIALFGVVFSIGLYFCAPAHMSRIGMTKDSFIIIAIMFSQIPMLYMNAKLWERKELRKLQKMSFISSVLSVTVGIAAIAYAVTNSAIALSLVYEPSTPVALYLVSEIFFTVSLFTAGLERATKKESTEAKDSEDAAEDKGKA